LYPRESGEERWTTEWTSHEELTECLCDCLYELEGKMMQKSL